MPLFIHIRNLLVRWFWSRQHRHYHSFSHSAVGGPTYLRLWKSNCQPIRWFVEIELDKRVHFLQLDAVQGQSLEIRITRRGLTLTAPAQNESLMRPYWQWAISGDQQLGHCLELTIVMISLSQDNLRRRDLLLRGIGRVGVALEGLLGSSPNYRALHGYVNKIDLCALGNIDDLRAAVNAPLEVGGRK